MSTFGYGDDAIFNMEDAKEKSGMNTSNEDLKNLKTNPGSFLTDNNLSLSDKTDDLKLDADADPSTTVGDFGKIDDVSLNTNQIDEAGMTNVTTPTNPGASTYTAETVEGSLGTPETTVNAAQGTITNQDLMDASTIEIDVGAEAEGAGVLGNALNEFASQGMSTIIDTTTIHGKLLAQKLGEGNYVDSKATIMGQLKILGDEFKDNQGNPIIPSWAQSTYRNVNRLMAFGDVTGTAAVRAGANAIMEATLGVADKEAEFFQTLTTKNLDNRQESIINRAKILAGFEEANLTARQAALKHNAQAFLDMNLKNVDNIQEAEIINTQERIEVLLSDAREKNTARRFGAEQANEMERFYDELDITTQKWRKEQLLNIKKFNTGEINDHRQFVAELDNLTDRFEAEQQRIIDMDNAKWRREVSVANFEMEFEAAAEDIKNGLDISTEALSRLWNRVDSELDYIYQGWNKEADRDAEILKTTITAQATIDAAAAQNANTSAIWDLASGYIRSGRGLNGALEDVNSLASVFGVDLDLGGAEGTGAILDLGGAISTVGGAIGSVGSAAGGAVSSAAGAVGTTLSGLGSAAGSAVAAAGPYAAALLAAYGIGKAIDLDLTDVDMLSWDLNPFDSGEDWEIDLFDW